MCFLSLCSFESHTQNEFTFCSFKLYVEFIKEISERDLAVIARDHLDNWESLRPFLGLSHAKEREICKSFQGDYAKQKHECLEAWKELNGRKATYSALIQAAEEGKAQNVADSVRSLLMNRQNIKLPHMEGE